jgi:hypothetical protein
MTWDIMILMRENPLKWPLDGLDPENQDFLGPEMAKSRVMDLPPSKSLIPSSI